MSAFSLLDLINTQTYTSQTDSNNKVEKDQIDDRNFVLPPSLYDVLEYFKNYRLYAFFNIRPMMEKLHIHESYIKYVEEYRYKKLQNSYSTSFDTALFDKCQYQTKTKHKQDLDSIFMSPRPKQIK